MTQAIKTRALGARGEDYAAEFLQAQGYEIVARNWRCAQGELDIVAFDPGAGALVFCEVKCRAGEGYGDPLEAITYAKLAKLRELALLWLAERGHHRGPVRIDAVGVVKRRGYAPRISHVRGIG